MLAQLVKGSTNPDVANAGRRLIHPGSEGLPKSTLANIFIYILHGIYLYIMDGQWTLLLYTLPQGKGRLRVDVWRQLRRFGCLALNTSAYVLPDRPSCHERLQWIAKRILDGGGEATISKVIVIEGLSYDEIRDRFNTQRNEDYLRLIKEATTLAPGKAPASRPAKKLDKLKTSAEQLRDIDYFGAPKAADLHTAICRLEKMLAVEASLEIRPALSSKDYSGQTWITRPFPEIDRCASAWLIRRFIDGKATFRFSDKKPKRGRFLTFDMLEADFTHEGDRCTFETLCARFGIGDPTANRIGEMVHDADLEDGKFGRVEAIGLDLMLKGLARKGVASPEILEDGISAIDALYQALGGKKS